MDRPTLSGLQSAAYHLCWLIGADHPGEDGAPLREAAGLLGPSDLPIEPAAFEAAAARLLWIAVEDFDALDRSEEANRVHAAVDLLTGAADPPPTRLVLEQVYAERLRQDAKWGEQNHDPFVWMSILLEECGEAAKAGLELRFSPPADFDQAAGLKALRNELVQVAAVAVSAIEALDRGEWTWGNHGR